MSRRMLSLAVWVLWLSACGGGALEQRGEPEPAGAVDAELSEGFPVGVTVRPPASPQYVAREVFGLNLIGSAATSKDAFYALFGNGATPAQRSADGLARLKAMGIRHIRFPGGCHGDGYDWKSNKMRFLIDGRPVEWDAMPVDDALAIARELGASLLFQLNVETKGLPNPCGWVSRYPDPSLTEEQKTAQLLSDARELLRRYSPSVRQIELGNEPWGAWQPAEYAQVALTFARQLKSIDPYVQVQAVGHPTTGNNQDPSAPPNGKDAAWTAAMKALVQDTSCNGNRCVNAVTDHPYVYAGYDPTATNVPQNFKGMAAYHPLTSAWIYRQRAADYAPARLSLTEWNLKCWASGHTGTQGIGLTNASFEEGTGAWGFWSNHPGIGAMSASAEQVRSGAKSLRVSLDRPSGQPTDMAQGSQVFAAGAGRKVRLTAWVRSSRPAYAQLILQQTNAGAHQWHHVAGPTPHALGADTWQALSVEGTTFADTSGVQAVLRVYKTGAQWAADPAAAVVFFDAVSVADVTHQLALANPSFEAGTAGWSFWSRQGGTGSMRAVTGDAVDGAGALEVSLTRSSGAGVDTAQASQPHPVTPGRAVRLTAQVKTSRPAYAQLILQQTNPGPHQWHHVAEASLRAVAPGVWQAVQVRGTPFEDTTQLQAVLRLNKTAAEWAADPSPATALFDQASLLDVHDFRPAVPASSTAEHGFFTLSSLLEMGRAGVSGATYHAFSRGTCGVAQVGAANAVELNPQGQAFRLGSVLAGGKLLDASTSSPTWTLPASSCSSPGCLPGGVAVPYVSAYAGYSADENELHLFLLNRHPQLGSNATVSLQGLDLAGMVRLSQVTLKANDFTDRAFQEVAVPPARVARNNPLSVYVPKSSIVRLTLSFERVYQLQLQAVCANGKAPTGQTAAFHALWPPSPLTWSQTPLSLGSQALTLTSRHRWNSVYVGLMGPQLWDQALPPASPLPLAQMSGGTYFNPPTFMVRWSAREVADGSYALRYQAPAALCPP